VNDVLKSELACNFSLSVVGPYAVATVHAKTTGLVQLQEYLKTLAYKGEESDDEEKLSADSD